MPSREGVDGEGGAAGSLFGLEEREVEERSGCSVMRDLLAEIAS
jgi:hypothetical protein